MKGNLQTLLKKLHACPAAVLWVGDRDLKECWNSCERADWMLWLVGNMAGKDGWPTHQNVVFAACACAETVLPIFEQKYPKDKRPRIAIETAQAWANEKASLDEVWSAAAAADASAAAAYAAYAADAAYSAYSAYAAAYSAAYAYAAAYSAVWATARAKPLKQLADIVRGILKVPDL